MCKLINKYIYLFIYLKLNNKIDNKKETKKGTLVPSIYIHVHIAQEMVKSHYTTCNTYAKSDITSKTNKTHIFFI